MKPVIFWLGLAGSIILISLIAHPQAEWAGIGFSAVVLCVMLMLILSICRREK